MMKSYFSIAPTELATLIRYEVPDVAPARGREAAGRLRSNPADTKEGGV